MKKLVFFFSFALAGFNSHAQTHSLTKLWSTDSVLKVPESVLFSAPEKLLYVSNIDGEAAGKDGKGSIGKVGLDGKIIAVDWVSGLNAPKGMGIYQGNLYVADLDAVAVIDIKSGKVVRRIDIEGAIFLNDLTIDNRGAVYVSDSRAKRIHKIENFAPAVLIDNLQSPNGVYFRAGKLYFLDAGAFYVWQSGKDKQQLAKGMEASTDGLEFVKEGEWLITSWIGAIYYVKEDGTVEELLKTKDQKINSADIGYDAQKKIVYVPTFARNSVVAYQLR